MDTRMWARAVRWAARLTVLPLLMLTMADAARASALPATITYSTTGWIGSPRSTTGSVTFEGLTGATIDGTGPVSLGSFVVKGGAGPTTFNNTPFGIVFEAPQFHQVVDASHSGLGITAQYDGIFEVSGVLNSVIQSPTRDVLVATFTGVSQWPSGVERSMDRVYLDGLPFPLSDVKPLAALGVPYDPGSGGSTPVSVTLVPEPGTLVMFLAGVSVVAAWRRGRR